MVNFEWAEWIRYERIKQKISVAELARKANTHRQVIYDYENFKRKNPDPLILARIATALGFPPAVIFQKSGILPNTPSIDTEIEVVNTLYEQLKDPENRKRAQDYLKFLLTQEGQNSRGKNEKGESA